MHFAAICRVSYNSSVKRAYGHEPILLTSSPITPLSKPVQPASKRRRKPTLIILAVVLLAGVGAITALLFRGPPASDRYLVQLASRVSFPLYGPQWLPDGWYIDQQSIDATAEVVTFTINDTQGKQLVFTEQPKPPQSNLDTFYNQQVSNSTAIDTAAGKVVIGQFEGSPLAGVSAGQTWILIRAVAAVDQQQFERFVSSLGEIQ